MIMIMTITFLVLLLPTMILVVLLDLIPHLRRNPAITYGIVALLVMLATVALTTLYGFGLLRGLAGVLTVGVLVSDYRRTVTRGVGDASVD